MIPRRLSLLLPLIALLSACAVPFGQTPTGGDVAPDGPVKVALLVPLGTGNTQEEGLAESLVNAAKLAQGDLQGVEVALTVHATAGTPEGADAAMTEALASEPDIILGPLFAGSTAVVEPRAAAAGLTVFSFSNDPSVAGGAVVTLGNSFLNTARRVVGYATEQGLRDIAVVSTTDDVGALALAATRQAAQAAGATIVAAEAYPRSIQGISEAGPAIAERLRAAAPEALVLTDGPTGGLAFIAETLRLRGVRSETVRLLGLQRWDASPQAMAQPALAGGWYAAPDQILVDAFASRYQARYGARPHPLAPLAYDGVAAIGALVAEARADGGGAAFSQARLTQPAGFAGVNGIFRILPGGLTERALAIYEVTDGQPRQISPAPRRFGVGGS
ncbi:MAG: penicillin-binding protein activator [Pseudomonadota bacterium]